MSTTEDELNQVADPCGRTGLPLKISRLRMKLSQKAKLETWRSDPIRTPVSQSGFTDVSPPPTRQRVPTDEKPTVSRMREIRTSGLKRGEERTTFLLYSTAHSHHTRTCNSCLQEWKLNHLGAMIYMVI